MNGDFLPYDRLKQHLILYAGGDPAYSLITVHPLYH
jgi:hypothetical protein